MRGDAESLNKLILQFLVGVGMFEACLRGSQDFFDVSQLLCDVCHPLLCLPQHLANWLILLVMQGRVSEFGNGLVVMDM